MYGLGWHYQLWVWIKGRALLLVDGELDQCMAVICSAREGRRLALQGATHWDLQQVAPCH